MPRNNLPEILEPLAAPTLVTVARRCRVLGLQYGCWVPGHSQPSSSGLTASYFYTYLLIEQFVVVIVKCCYSVLLSVFFSELVLETLQRKTHVYKSCE